MTFAKPKSNANACKPLWHSLLAIDTVLAIPGGQQIPTAACVMSQSLVPAWPARAVAHGSHVQSPRLTAFNGASPTFRLPAAKRPQDHHGPPTNARTPLRSRPQSCLVRCCACIRCNLRLREHARVDVYYASQGSPALSSRGHAETWLGRKTVIVPASGTAAFTIPITAPAHLPTSVLSMTATRNPGGTSELGIAIFTGGTGVALPEPVFPDGFE